MKCPQRFLGCSVGANMVVRGCDHAGLAVWCSWYTADQNMKAWMFHLMHGNNVRVDAFIGCWMYVLGLTGHG